MNNDKNIQTRNRAKAIKDPLKGAPGHMNDEATDSDQGTSLKVRNAASKTDVEVDKKISLPKNVDEALELIGSTFGEGNVKRFRELLSSNAANAETKIKDLMGALSSRPMASAAAVATGVGAIFLLREYLNRDSAPNKKVAGANRLTASSKGKKKSKSGKRK